MHSKGNGKLYVKILLKSCSSKRPGYPLQVLFSTLGFVLSLLSMFFSVIHIKKNSQKVVNCLFVGNNVK